MWPRGADGECGCALEAKSESLRRECECRRQRFVSVTLGSAESGPGAGACVVVIHPCSASPCSPSGSGTPHSEGPICWRLSDLCQMSKLSVTLQSLEEAGTQPLWESPGSSWPGGGLERGPDGKGGLGASEAGGLVGSCLPQTREVKDIYINEKKGLSCFLGTNAAA